MDCNPLQTGVTTPATFAWHTTRARLATVLVGVLLVVPILNDLLRPHDNLSILYLLPMLVCGWLGQRRLLRKIMVLCIFLTYAGLAMRIWLNAPNPFWKWGLLNRSFVAVALCIGDYLLESMLTNLQQRSTWRPARMDAEHVIIEEIIFSSQRFAAIFTAVLLALGIFVLDLITPGQLNCPILYSLPLLMIVWTRSHTWLWSVVALVVVLAIVGWFTGEAPTITPNLFAVLMVNRCIAIAMLLGFGVIIHLATSSPYSKKIDRLKPGVNDLLP